MAKKQARKLMYCSPRRECVRDVVASPHMKGGRKVQNEYIYITVTFIAGQSGRTLKSVKFRESKRDKEHWNEKQQRDITIDEDESNEYKEKTNMSDITERTINSSKVIITPKKKKVSKAIKNRSPNKNKEKEKPKNTENTTPKLASHVKTRRKGKSKSQNHKRKKK